MICTTLPTWPAAFPLGVAILFYELLFPPIKANKLAGLKPDNVAHGLNSAKYRSYREPLCLCGYRNARYNNHRDTEDTEVAQRRVQFRTQKLLAEPPAVLQRSLPQSRPGGSRNNKCIPVPKISSISGPFWRLCSC